jgi:CheY-like chemotaxis protein
MTGRPIRWKCTLEPLFESAAMFNVSDALEFHMTDENRCRSQGPSVLVVEDHALIALDLEAMLLDLGAARVLIANTADHALKLVATQVFDAALVDIRINSSTSLAVAGALRDKGIPFAFSSGYAKIDSIPAEFQTRPLIEKPYAEHDVSTVWRALIGTSATR